MQTMMTSTNGDDENTSLLSQQSSKETVTTTKAVRDDEVLPRLAPTRSLATSFMSSPVLDYSLTGHQKQLQLTNGNHPDMSSHRQQECSSNQSGSDSGLGCTNSFSSDNNSYTANALANAPLASSKYAGEQSHRHEYQQQQVVSESRIREVKDAQERKTQDIDSTDFNVDVAKISAKTSSKSITKPNVGSNRKLMNNDLNNKKCDNETSYLSMKDAAATKISKQNNEDSNIASKHELISPSKSNAHTKNKSNRQNNFSDTGAISEPSSPLFDGDATNSHGPRSHATLDDVQSVDYIAAFIRDVSVDERDIDDVGDSSVHEVAVVADDVRPSNIAQQDESMSPQSQLTLLESTSKRGVAPVLRSALKKSTNSSATVPNRSVKSPRNVSFNQTVIVFCEEIETSSPSDQCDPPAGYQDNATFDNDTTSDESSARKKDDKSLFFQDFIRNDLDLFNKIVGEDASKLTDEQLFGLLENEPLLEKIKLNCDDYSDEDMLTVGGLNSDQSYLCRDAISDSEDSELSFGFEERKSAQTKTFRQNASSKEGRAEPHDSTADQAKVDYVPENDHQSECLHRANASQHKHSLPARMKVSTVDNCSTRRRLRSIHHNDDHAPEQSSHGCTLKQAKLLNNRETIGNQVPRTVMIKQSNVEPIAVSKSMFVQNNLIDKATQPSHQPSVQNHEDRKVATEISNAGRHVTISRSPINQDVDSLDVKQHQVDNQQESSTLQSISKKPTQKATDSQAQILQTQPACHVCRAIESNQSQALPMQSKPLVQATPIAQANLSQSRRTDIIYNQHSAQIHHQPHQYQLRPFHQANTISSNFGQSLQSYNPNQGCVSCQEASLPQNINRTQLAAQHGTAVIPQAKPVACQIVYVVDQNGNRIRALQVLGAAMSQQQLRQNMQPRQIILTPSGNRFPSAISSHQGGNYIQTSVSNDENLTQGASIVRSPQYTIMAQQSNQVVPQVNAHQQQQRQIAIPILAASGLSQSGQQAQRHHTVHYVRQPLAAHNIRQSSDSIDNSKSFPDPHEVRRLDGIRGPTNNINLSQRDTHQASIKELQAGKANNAIGQTKRDSVEDPSFGFSNRPSVKVFQANSNANVGGRVQRAVEPNNQTFSAGLTIIRRDGAQTSERLPIVVLGSQTLDRRGNIRDQQASYNVTKDNIISSTSSMSDINRSALGDQEVIYGCENAHQARNSRSISKASPDNNNLLSRGIPVDNLKRWLNRKLSSLHTNK